jgi:hypothetical protein
VLYLINFLTNGVFRQTAVACKPRQAFHQLNRRSLLPHQLLFFNFAFVHFFIFIFLFSIGFRGQQTPSKKNGLTKAKPRHYIATICHRCFDTLFISQQFLGWTHIFNSQFLMPTHILWHRQHKAYRSIFGRTLNFFNNSFSVGYKPFFKSSYIVLQFFNHLGWTHSLFSDNKCTASTFINHFSADTKNLALTTF